MSDKDGAVSEKFLEVVRLLASRKSRRVFDHFIGDMVHGHGVDLDRDGGFVELGDDGVAQLVAELAEAVFRQVPGRFGIEEKKLFGHMRIIADYDKIVFMRKAAKTPKKKMTIEDLARITQNGFSGMEKRLNERFDNVESRLTNVEDRLKEVELGQRKNNQDILNLGEKFPTRFEFDNLSTRVWNLEHKKSRTK